jgi:processive 1,2-diacylglycerol beta-glucosyltransferase
MARITVCSVSAGAGHLRAAEAVCAAARARGHEAVHIDVMDLVPRLFRKVYADSYLGVVEKRPALWGYLYHVSDRPKADTLAGRLRRAVERLNTRRLTARLAETAPDAVVCTHFLPAQILARLKGLGRFAPPVWTVVTDFDVHALWIHPVDGYAVASEEVAVRLRDRDPAARRIAVTGIPISPVFAAPPPRAVAAAELGLDHGKPTFLLMSGGFGVGAIDLLAERILSVPGDFQLVALAGRNAELLARLEALALRHPGRLRPMGFTKTIERVMACADLAISKPGGLTTAECLAVGLPMLVVSPIPGQEERNADHLLEHGAALKAHDAAGVEHRVRRVLAEPDLLPRLRAAARTLGRADAADRVLDAVLP